MKWKCFGNVDFLVGESWWLARWRGLLLLFKRLCLVIIRWQENGPLKDAFSLLVFFSLGMALNPRGIGL